MAASNSTGTKAPPKHERQNLTTAIASNPLGYAKPPASMNPGPNAYALNCDGDCMAPEFNNGDTVICDPDNPAALGDYVVVWWKGGTAPPNIKRLALALPPRELWCGGDWFEAALVVEQINPRKRLAADLSRIEAVHKVLGKQEANHG